MFLCRVFGKLLISYCWIRASWALTESGSRPSNGDQILPDDVSTCGISRSRTSCLVAEPPDSDGLP